MPIGSDAGRARSPAPASEPLERPRLDGATISAGVVSNGCTSSASFRVEHEVRDGACRVTVLRVEPDRCRRTPRIVRVDIPWSPPSDCGTLPIEFTNPAAEPPPSLPGRRPPSD